MEMMLDDSLCLSYHRNILKRNLFDCLLSLSNSFDL